jgi:LPS export ABC transporter protein LptC
MKRRLRGWLAFAFIVLVVAAAWLVGTGTPQAPTADPDANRAAYNFEANEVVVRQMGTDGRLQYQIEARHVTQLPKDGAIAARDLTLHFDPPGSADPQLRWTLTANAAQLPESSSLVALHGNVQVQGRPAKAGTHIQLATESLDYNLATQDLRSTGDFELRWGGTFLTGRGLSANIKQGDLQIESSAHGQIVP